jgi:hypothetical protein
MHTENKIKNAHCGNHEQLLFLLWATLVTFITLLDITSCLFGFIDFLRKSQFEN